MRTLLLIAGITTVLISCKDQASERKVRPTTAQSDVKIGTMNAADVVYTERKKVDTLLRLTDTSFTLGDYTLTFKKVKEIAVPDLAQLERERAVTERSLPEDIQKRLSRNKNTLTVKMDDGKTVSFTDRGANGEELLYAFEQYYPAIKHGLVQVIEGSESVSYSFLNFANGKQKYLIGWPSIAPSGKRIIAANEDMEAGFSSNGFQVLTPQGDSLVNNFTIETGQWAPYGIKWVSDNECIFKIHRQVQTETGIDYKTDYYQFTIN